MPEELLPRLIFLAGFLHLSIFIASALVPIRLDWRKELATLPLLHWQMYLIYAAYVVMSIAAFAFISIFNADALTDGSRLSRCFCGYVAIFWGIRLSLQPILDVKEHLRAWWLNLGCHTLSVLFATFTILYGWVAIRGLI